MDLCTPNRPTRRMRLANLLLGTLLLSLFLGLPLGHQLFHDLSVEPESCPFHMLESSLVQLSITAAIALSPAVRRAFVSSQWSVPQFLLFSGFSLSNRAPPRFA